MMYRLRTFKKDDFTDFSRWVDVRDELVNVFGEIFSFPLQRQHFDAFFAERGEPEKSLRYVLEEKVTKRVVGICCFTCIDQRYDSGHIGFVMVCPELRGKGIGTRMLQLFLKEAFESRGFHRVSLKVMEDNPIARRVYAEKIGFVEEGFHRDAVKLDGEYKSYYSMSLLEPEWRSGN